MVNLEGIVMFLSNPSKVTFYNIGGEHNFVNHEFPINVRISQTQNK